MKYELHVLPDNPVTPDDFAEKHGLRMVVIEQGMYLWRERPEYRYKAFFVMGDDLKLELVDPPSPPSQFKESHTVVMGMMPPKFNTSPLNGAFGRLPERAVENYLIHINGYQFSVNNGEKLIQIPNKWKMSFT